MIYWLDERDCMPEDGADDRSYNIEKALHKGPGITGDMSGIGLPHASYSACLCPG